MNIFIILQITKIVNRPKFSNENKKKTTTTSEETQADQIF